MKLLEVIKELTDSEVRQMRKLLRSPFFTIRSELLSMFNQLIKYKNGKRGFPEPEQMFRDIYGEESAWNYARLRNDMSDLLVLIEECWLINNRRSHKLESKLVLSKIYRQRKLEKPYQSTVKKAKSLIEQQKKRNADYYGLVLEFQEEQNRHQSSTKRTANLYLQEISDSRDILFLSQKLHLACAQLSHQLVYKTTYDYGLLNHLLQQIEKEKYLQIPAIAIYYYCFRFLTESDNLQYFEIFKEQLNKYQHYFTKTDLEAPYRLALNFCIRKTNEGIAEFVRHSWDLSKEGIAEGILLENNLIPRFTFNNVIAAALRLKEFNWVADFIKNSAHQLEPSFREQTISFNLARLEFTQGNSEKALVHLQSAEYKDLVNALISKMLLIKIYIELEEFEALDSHLESFRQFIRRREVSDYHRENFLNIIRYTQKIVTTPKYAKAERRKLLKEIKEETVLTEREWLLDWLEK